MRFRYVLRPAALTALLPAVFVAAAAAASVPWLSVRAARDTLVPDEAGLWQMEIVFHNPLVIGLYADSLVLQARDGDPGTTRLARVTRTDLSRLAAAFSPISSGDSTRLMFTPPATFERGELAFDWYAHDAHQGVYHASTSLRTAGGPLADAHPSRFLNVGGRRVEIVEFSPDSGGAAIGVLLVHGHGSHARRHLQLAARLAASGMGVVLVSQPGYGQSDGPPDLAGPATMAALEAALGALRALPGVNRSRLAVWGEAGGATAALLLAERQPAGLAAVVALGGLYDLAGWLATAAPSSARQTALGEAGTQPAAWAARSPLAAAAKVKANVLLIHGRTDDTAPIAQARALAAALRAGGASVDTLFLPGGSHLARSAVTRAATDFLARLSTH